MKDGRSLQELVMELERQKETKKDFIATTQSFQMDAENLWTADDKPTEYTLSATSFDPTYELPVVYNPSNSAHHRFDIRETAHRQIANKVGIPWKYYQKMLTKQDGNDLLAVNVNEWFQYNPKRQMLRTLDGNLRAFLSDKYRPLDNYELCSAILPSLATSGMEIKSCEVTDSRLYLKAVSDKVQGEIRQGDIVQAGVCISNSEIGLGSVKVEPLIFRLVCSNGMISVDHSLRKTHIGRGFDGDDNMAQEFFKDETRKADDAAFYLKVRDVVAGTFEQTRFDKLVDKMRASAEREITGDPMQVVEVTQKEYDLSDDERGGIMSALISGADMTQWGLANAVTFTSQTVPDYDRATELERLGGEIMELPQTRWDSLVAA